jgi:hypothetical protein
MKKQGTHFIKKKEGFGIFDNTLKSAIDKEEKTIQSITAYYKRTAPASNPYLGKNIQFKNGIIGYVTNKGVFKWYNNNFYDNAGKNGCPKEITQVDITTDLYNSPGSFIPTTPPLLVGKPMISGQSCGFEGSNVIVSDKSDNNASYLGCYNDFGGSLQSGDSYSFASCQQLAYESGSSYFGLGGGGGSSQCFLTNDIQQTGVADEFTTTILWQSNTSSANSTMILGVGGYITLLDMSGNIVQTIDTGDSNNCQNGAQIANVEATWGANCSGTEIGNITSSINTLLDANPSVNRNSYNYIIGQDYDDPSSSGGVCARNFDVYYSCGSVGKTGHVDGESYGQNFLFDCSSEILSCLCYLILEDDGNMCIYKGASPDATSKSLLWNANTKAIDTNPQWVASLGKSGLNWFSSNHGLSSGEWIGSNNGSVKLIMQSDGNLVLYTSTQSPGCTKQSDGNMYGSTKTYAAYKMPDYNKDNIGKIGYIDSDTNLHPYPNDMIKPGNTYTQYPGFDSIGNDLYNVANQTVDSCTTLCNDNSDCYGFVFDTANNCYLKNA